ncbi:MAG TPA: hypothetical protein DCY41_07740 [Opitutae bacterium]|nr:hypothetical protein [Opitutae bacterium]
MRNLCFSIVFSSLLLGVENTVPPISSYPHALKGNRSAMRQVGNYYDDQFAQSRIQQQRDESLRWYKKASNEGETNCSYRLFQIYSEGDGVPQDDAEANDWLNKAAQGGYRTAHGVLGERIAKGIGTKASDIDALYELLIQASISGLTGEQSNLRDKILARISPAEAERAATEAFRYIERRNKPVRKVVTSVGSSDANKDRNDGDSSNSNQPEDGTDVAVIAQNNKKESEANKKKHDEQRRKMIIEGRERLEIIKR